MLYIIQKFVIQERGPMVQVRNEAYALLILATIALISHVHIQGISSLAKNDPYPMFTTLDPQEFLYTQDKLLLKGMTDKEHYWKEHVSFSASPFSQNARCGKDFCGSRFRGIDNRCNPTPCDTIGRPVPIELGDIAGRWNMIALLFGDLPEGVDELPPLLEEAQNTLFNGPPTIEDINAIDPEQLFGCFSVPLKYKKQGVRFDLEANICDDVCIGIQVGVADITQCVPQTFVYTGTIDTITPITGTFYDTRRLGFINLTCAAGNTCTDTAICPIVGPIPTPACAGSTSCSATSTQGQGCVFPCTDLTAADVNCALMNNLFGIAHEIGLDVGSFDKTSIEDVRLRLYWRHAYPAGRCNDSADVLVIPYFLLEGSLGTGKKIEPHKAFSLPFGNNGSNSVAFTAGINFDCPETVEFGLEGGFTHFFKEDFCNFRVPTFEGQTGIFPFSTAVSVHPGNNWHFAAKLSAYHFLECLSFWFQYVIVHHKKDNICVINGDPAFKPHVLEERSAFQSQFGNFTLNYDITPCISIGFLWQAPFVVRNSYRSTTYLFSVNAFF